MKIAFDAKRAYLNNSGLGNYSRTFIKTLALNNLNVVFFLFTPSFKKSVFTDQISALPNVNIITPAKALFHSIWRFFSITNELINLKVDVYHGLSNELPLNIKKFKGKKIVTIHDLIFLRHPNLYPIIDRWIYKRKSLAACENADIIIAISEETKKDIIHFFNIPSDKIRVVYQSCDDVFYQNYDNQEQALVVKKYNLPSKYLLYVGTIEERKNLLVILKAIKTNPSIPLVVVGKETDYMKQVNLFISENGMKDQVIFLKNVPTPDLPIIYQKATLFIYPSIIEGFGIPIIEALISKTPVITNRFGCFPEAAGPHSVFIDPKSDDELLRKILELWNNDSQRIEMALNGLLYAQKFDKQFLGEQLLGIYQES